MKKVISSCALLLFMAGSLTGCVTQMGSSGAKSVATGSAGGEHSENVHAELVHCESPFGTMAVNEDHSTPWYSFMVGKYGIQSTVPVLRLLAQQSNCFVIVERGNGFNNVAKERVLQQTGELRQDSNFGKGQMVAADYTVTPTLIYKQNHVGGIGMMAGAFVPVVGNYLGALVSGMSYSDSQSLLTLVDNRSGVQVSVAEGSSRGMDIGGVLGMLDPGSGGGGLSAYARTSEGKLIVASMTDAYNNLVSAAKNYKPQKVTGPKGMGTGGALQVN